MRLRKSRAGHRRRHRGVDETGKSILCRVQTALARTHTTGSPAVLPIDGSIRTKGVLVVLTHINAVDQFMCTITMLATLSWVNLLRMGE